MTLMANGTGQIYNVGSCFFSAIFGLTVYITKQFKYTCLEFGLPMILLGVGLMIHFRFAGTGIGWIVMCQIFIAFGGGTLVIGEDMAVMAASERGEVPMMLSLIGLCSSLGGAVGYATIPATFANVFEGTLRGDLTGELVERLYKGGYVRQEGFPVGGVVISGDVGDCLHLSLQTHELSTSSPHHEQTIKHAILTALIIHLTLRSPPHHNLSFTPTFLATYPAFTIGQEVSNLLQRLYDPPPSDLHDWTEQEQTPFRTPTTQYK